MPCESLRFGGYGTYGLPTTELLSDSDIISEIALASTTSISRPLEAVSKVS